MLKRILWKPYICFSSLFFDPLVMIKKWKALPFFMTNLYQYNRKNLHGPFKFRLSQIWYSSHDRFASAGRVKHHYFFQDLWAAEFIFSRVIKKHVDLGSRIDGFIAHILPYCHVQYIDIRPVDLDLKNFEFKQGSILNMPFEDNSIESLSSLHVLEHIGLGRYGDPVDPQGYLSACRELARVLKPGGTLLLGTPVGFERLCFDAHRIFAPETIVEAMKPLHLKEFSLIDDHCQGIIKNASFDQAGNCHYGCGLFVFTK